jgi:hypothetical protein
LAAIPLVQIAWAKKNAKFKVLADLTAIAQLFISHADLPEGVPESKKIF